MPHLGCLSLSGSWALGALPAERNSEKGSSSQNASVTFRESRRSGAWPFAAMAAPLPGLRRLCAALRGSPSHEDPPVDPASRGRPQGDQLGRELCSPYAPAPRPRTKRGRSSAAARPRRGTRILAGLPRAARPARPLRRRRGSGSFEALRSQHRLRGRCRGPPRRAAASGAGLLDVLGFWRPRWTEACRQ